MELSVHEKWYKFCPNCKTKLQRKLIDTRERSFCPECDFIFWNNPKPVVSVLISKNNKVLMLQRAKEPLKEYWVLPGGFVDYEETPEEAAIREAEEETGCKIKLNKLIGVYRIDNDPSGVNIDIIYEGEAKGDVRISEENQNYKFFSIDNLPEKIAYKHREAIADFLQNPRIPQLT